MKKILSFLTACCMTVTSLPNIITVHAKPTSQTISAVATAGIGGYSSDQGKTDIGFRVGGTAAGVVAAYNSDSTASTDVKAGLARFDLGEDAGSADKYELKLSGGSIMSGRSGNINLYVALADVSTTVLADQIPVGEAWTSNSISWNTRPTLLTTEFGTPNAVVTPPNNATIDVTKLLQDKTGEVTIAVLGEKAGNENGDMIFGNVELIASSGIEDIPELDEVKWTFGNAYNEIKDFTTGSLSETEIGNTGFNVSTSSSNYNNAVVRDKLSTNSGYYPYGNGLPENGYYLFLGAGGNGSVSASLTLPATVPAGKYIKITYAKPYATNNGSANRNSDNNPDDTITVGGEVIDLKANCDFDTWYTSTVKLNTDVSQLAIKLGAWGAAAISSIEVVTSADTMELMAEDDITEKYIIPGEEQTVQYMANVYKSIMTLMDEDEIIARGTVDTTAKAKYSVDYNGVSINSESGLLTITDKAKPGTATVSATYGDITKSAELELLELGDADSMEITGDELVEKGKTYTYHAIPKVNGVVIPERATTWSIDGDNHGCSIDGGVLTVPADATAGNITIKAVLDVTGVQTTANVFDTYTVTIKDSSIQSEYIIDGIFLKDGKMTVSEAEGVTGVITYVPVTALTDGKMVVKAVNSKGIGIASNEVSLNNYQTPGVQEIKTALSFKAGDAAEIRAYIVNGSGEIISDVYTAAAGEYKNVPIVSDWITGARSGLGMGAGIISPAANAAPYGVDPELVDLTNSITYDNANAPKASVDNALWYNTGAYVKDVSLYARDGADWEQQALPIGNGYMGGMLFGMPHKDQIQINEETFWAAGYRGTQTAVNSDSVNKNMSEGINGYMSIGNIFVDFDDIPGNAKVKNYYRDLNLDEAMAHVQYEYNDITYNREYFASYPKKVLAFRYTADGGDLNFTVKPLSMHPGDVTVNNGEITIIGKLKDSEPYDAGGNAAWNQESDLEYCTKIKVIADNGVVTDGYNKVGVKGATGVTILVTAATDYDKDQFELNADGSVNMTKTPYKSTHGVQAAIDKATSRMNGAAAVEYADLKAEHITDYKSQFDTVQFSLTDENEVYDQPTDVLQKSYKDVINTVNDGTEDTKAGNNDEHWHGTVNYDKSKYNALSKHLEELHFNYARYMMISSSRSDTMPATLQGKWCQSTAEIWGSCYCININMEMNYWFAGGANLLDSGKSLIGWFNSQIPAGKITAKNYYKVTPKSYTLNRHTITFTDSTAPEDEVFIMHTKQAIMGTTDLTGSTSIQSPGNTAWLMYNLWDLYQTSGDEKLLKDDLYPIMRQVANFYTQYLYNNLKRTTADTDTYPDGYYYTTWSGRSPEHGPIQEGQKYDLQLVAGMYDYTIAAAEILGIDAEKVAAWKEVRNHLETPVELGTDGQIKEWKQEAAYGMDSSGNQLGGLYHRHISHLVGLYPGTLITRENPDWLNGAKVVLENRGDVSTGWSCSNKFLLWARALNGDKALDLFRYQLAQRTYANLFDAHTPFQIDGNFGSATGIMELLMQSQTGTIYILPALPKVWDKGEISGIKAKNGAEVDIKWADNKLTSAVITPAKDGDIEIGYDAENTNLKVTDKDGTEVVLEKTDDIYVLRGVLAGMEYTIVPTSDKSSQTPEPSDSIRIELGASHVSVTFGDNPRGVLILAGYDGTGAMKKIEIIDGYEYDISGYDGCVELKAFLWDSVNGMEPLCGSESILL